MDDQVGGRAQVGARGEVGTQALLGAFPELQHVRQLLVAHHDQQIEVGEVAADRIFDPVTPGV